MPNQLVVRVLSGEKLDVRRRAIDSQLGSLWRDIEWVTQDNRPMKLREMADQHLINALHYFRPSEEAGETSTSKLRHSLLVAEASYRGLSDESAYMLVSAIGKIRSSITMKAMRDGWRVDLEDDSYQDFEDEFGFN